MQHRVDSSGQNILYDTSSFVNVSEPLRLGNLAHFYHDAFGLKDDTFRARVCISGYRYLYICIDARCRLSMHRDRMLNVP